MLILKNLQKHMNLRNMIKLDMLLNVISANRSLPLQSKKIIFGFLRTVISFLFSFVLSTVLPKCSEF